MSEIIAIALAQLTTVPYSVRKAWVDNHAIDKSKLDLKSAEKEWANMQKRGVWVLAYGSENYPSMLAEIPNPPLALFGLGKLPAPEKPLLGFVGPRKPSTYGARVAKLLAEDLVNEGVVLVSGLARGIDAIAHEASVKVNAPTIAVVASGLDKIYPPEHAMLQSKILKAGGAVISEFPLNTPPLAEQFPQRNRIISGLSKGVLLIEAGERSGARITTRHAAEQSREVFAVPGPIDSPLSIVPNQLISQGAKLVATTADILEELIPGFVREETEQKNKKERQQNLSQLQKNLLENFERDVPVALDDLVLKSRLPIQQVMHLLTELEMKGLVGRHADARYVRM